MRTTIIKGFILLAALLTMSCSNETDGTEPDNEKAQIVFTLAMETGQQGTRAAWQLAPNGTAYIGGDEYENRIDMSSLQALVYGAQNKLIGKVSDVWFERNAEDDYEYTIHGTMPVDKSEFDDDGTKKLNCKLVVFANCNEVNVEKDSEMSVLADEWFAFSPDNFTASKTDEEKQSIPMWGVHKSELTLRLGESADAGTIHLLRALAKVKVSLSDELAKVYKLSDVSLNNYNTKGYTVPAATEQNGVKMFTTVDDTQNLDDEGSLHEYVSKAGKPLPFTLVSDENNNNADNGQYVVYVPEFTNDGTKAQPVISLKLKKKTDEVGSQAKEYKVYFKKYNDNGYATDENLNIVRNTIYKYTITAVTADVQLTLKYQVMDWSVSGNEVEFW